MHLYAGITGCNLGTERFTRTESSVLLIVAPLAVITLATTAMAQFSGNQPSPRERLRERYSPSRESSSDVNDAIRKLRSDDATERLEAIRALAASDDEKVVPYLLGAVADSDMRVRVKAIDELGNRMVTDATPVLVQQLFLRETEPAVQQRVLAALGKIRDPRSTRPICEFLARDLDPSTRGTAVFALGEIGDRTAVDVLMNVAANGDDPTVCRLAEEAVRKIEQREPPPVELPALADDRGR